MSIVLVCRRIAAVSVLCAAALAQTGTLDQVSLFGGPFSTTTFDTSLASNRWQAQVRVGVAGPLEGFQLMLEGPIGAQVGVRVRIGAGWNLGPIAFQTQLTKATAFPELVFVDTTSANIVLYVSNKFVIEFQGNGTGCTVRGTHVLPAMGLPGYPEPLFLNGPGCYSDCGSRIGFATYVITPPTPPVVYCTSGVTTNGCLASISANANPRVTHATQCQVDVVNVEGVRTGIIFYALEQLVQPWCSGGGGSSYLCVKPPTMRTGVQGSGGTLGSCNGALALDWNAFQLAQPSALGAPWAAGAKAYVQGWFRDPQSCKTTSLSNAIELTYLP